MKYDTFTQDEDGKYAECLEQCRVKLRVNAGAESEDIHVALQKILKELWNADVNKQFDTTWKKIIQYLGARLPREWTDAVRENYHQDMLIPIAKMFPKDGKFEYSLKTFWLNIIVRYSFAVVSMKELIGDLCDKIAPKLARSRQWTPAMLRWLWDFLAFNWGTIIKDYFNPRTFLDISILQSPKMALKSLHTFFCWVHCDNRPIRYAGIVEHAKSMIDVEYYQFESQIAGIHLPAYLARHGSEVMNKIFDASMKNVGHGTRKSNMYAIAMATALVNDHGDWYEERINTAKYKDDLGIDSDVVNRGSLKDSFGVAVNNFEGSTKGISPARDKAIKATIDGLRDAPFDSSYAKDKLGLCTKVRELAEECMSCVFTF